MTTVVNIPLEPSATIPPGVAGRLVVCEQARWFGAAGSVALDLTEAELQDFADWALTRLFRLFAPDGSEPDAWTRRPDGLLEASAPRCPLPPLTVHVR